VNIKGECLLKMIHHVARTLWTPNLERCTATTADPAGRRMPPASINVLAPNC
jgi:hypothetical protein